MPPLPNDHARCHFRGNFLFTRSAEERQGGKMASGVLGCMHGFWEGVGPAAGNVSAFQGRKADPARDGGLSVLRYVAPKGIHRRGRKTDALGRRRPCVGAAEAVGAAWRVSDRGDSGGPSIPRRGRFRQAGRCPIASLPFLRRALEFPSPPCLPAMIGTSHDGSRLSHREKRRRGHRRPTPATSGGSSPGKLSRSPCPMAV